MTLQRVYRLDSMPLDDTYFTGEGYLIDSPVLTSTGIFEYKKDGKTRRELRLPEHVFDEDSLASYEGKPVIVTHDAKRVDKNNVDDEIVGTILTKGVRDGDDVRAKIVIHNIDEVRGSGLRELSLGYGLDTIEEPGVWNGQPYDAIQTDIQINHLALVSEARAGDQARLNLDGKSTPLEGGKVMSVVTKDKKVNAARSKNPLADYIARRQRRNDEDDPENVAADTELENEDEDTTDPVDDDEPASGGNGGMAGDEGGNGDEPDPGNGGDVDDKLKFVTDRRSRRDEAGDPATLEEAMIMIADQDEEIDALFEAVDELKATMDFDSAKTKNADADKECQDADEGDDEEDPESAGGAPPFNADSKDAIERIVRERLNLARIGDKLRLDGIESMSTLDARKAIIRKVNPKLRLDGKSNAYIRAAFDLAVDSVNMRKGTDYQRRQTTSRADGASHAPTGRTSADRAREGMIDRMANGGSK